MNFVALGLKIYLQKDIIKKSISFTSWETGQYSYVNKYIKPREIFEKIKNSIRVEVSEVNHFYAIENEEGVWGFKN